MKHRNITKLLSFTLAILAVVMLLPFGTLIAYAEDDGNQISELLVDGIVTDEQNVVVWEDAEEETEVVYHEYEVEGSDIIAPPMTEIGDIAEPNALTILADGVYAIENVGNDNFYLSVEGAQIASGYSMQQKNYSSTTPLTDFSRVSLFKVSRVGTTNKYIIRSMLCNRMSFDIDPGYNEDKLFTHFIDLDDSQVSDANTYTITYSGGSYIIKPYGSTNVVAAPNSTSSDGALSQIILTTQAEAGNRGKWNFTKYTGVTQYGFLISRTAGMGDGLVKGSTGTIWVNSWSTVIGANTPYIAVNSGYTSIATSSWTASNFSAKITARKCGDFEVKAEIRSGSSQNTVHSSNFNYTVIPNVVGDTAYVQNVATGKYMAVESASTANGGIVQQWSFHTQPQMKWVFELGGGGYFKIKSVNSGKYLGVDSSDTTKVKQYSSVTDYTLWKISETSSGNYKFACKALESSGKVLCAPAITSGDGADLTMLVYGDNSSYIDEWKIYEVKILNDVPTSLRSTSDHLCIPCAITNIAGFWSINGYSQFGCSTSTQQETVARAVHQKMQNQGGSATANRNIQIGCDYFSHTNGSKTYIMESTNIWRGDAEFSIETVKNEIDAGRPLMIGYAAVNGSPYSGHMTVCTGYDFSGGSFYVYVSDAHNSTYQRHLFNENTYNDFIATVECTVGSN